MRGAWNKTRICKVLSSCQVPSALPPWVAGPQDVYFKVQLVFQEPQGKWKRRAPMLLLKEDCCFILHRIHGGRKGGGEEAPSGSLWQLAVCCPLQSRDKRLRSIHLSPCSISSLGLFGFLLGTSLPAITRTTPALWLHFLFSPPLPHFLLILLAFFLHLSKILQSFHSFLPLCQSQQCFSSH